jgi:hypothetical protein
VAASDSPALATADLGAWRRPGPTPPKRAVLDGLRVEARAYVSPVAFAVLYPALNSDSAFEALERAHRSAGWLATKVEPAYPVRGILAAQLLERMKLT